MGRRRFSERAPNSMVAIMTKRNPNVRMPMNMIIPPKIDTVGNIGPNA